MSTKSPTTILPMMLVCLLCTTSRVAIAQLLLDDLPANAIGIDVEDKVGLFVPLDLIFEDERGNKIGLGKFFNQGKPIVLTLNYSDCPGLCIAQLDNLVATLRAMNAEGLSEDYEIVTVSIDPNESSEKARQTKSKYTGMLRGTEAEQGWHFLTGNQKSISALADAVGFRYVYDRANQRYNHPAATFFISPSGRICRYLLSLGVEPDQFKLAVAEAHEGRLAASLSDAIIQFCYLYNPDANRYSADARRIMAFGGGAFCLLLMGSTAPFWFSGRKTRKDKSVAGAAKEPSDADAAPEIGTDAYNTTEPISNTPTGLPK